MATNNGAYSFLLRLVGPGEESRSVRSQALPALTAVMDSNPDYLESQGVSHFYSIQKLAFYNLPYFSNVRRQFIFCSAVEWEKISFTAKLKFNSIRQ